MDFDDNTDEKPREFRWRPLLICGGVVVGVGMLLGPFVSPGLRRHSLPYIPATDGQLNDALSLTRLALTRLSVGSEGRIIDLGSGDGRVVIQACKELGVHGEGVELNRWLVLYSTLQAARAGLHSRVKFHAGDMWKTDLSDYQLVYLFLGSEMMKEMETKLDKELLSKNAAIVTTRFGLPNWKATEKRGLATLYLSTDQKPKVETAEVKYHPSLPVKTPPSN